MATTTRATGQFGMRMEKDLKRLLKARSIELDIPQGNIVSAAVAHLLAKSNREVDLVTKAWRVAKAAKYPGRRGARAEAPAVVAEDAGQVPAGDTSIIDQPQAQP